MPAIKIDARPLNRVKLPVDLVFTEKVLVGTIKKLETEIITRIVDNLIDELNYREGDDDLEFEDDFEGYLS